MADNERLSDASVRVTEFSKRPSEGSERLICASGELAESGDGVRFELEWEGETVPAFAIRHSGGVYAYLNRCAHIAMELDWTAGKFFDAGGEYLICSTHGAWYAPDSGVCHGGPCRGAKLVRLNVFEAGGKVYLKMKG